MVCSAVVPGQAGPGRVMLAQRCPGAAECHRDGFLAAAEDARGVAGREAEHVAQEQHGTGPRGQQLQRGDKRQGHRFVPLDMRFGARVGGGQAVEQRLG
jgi:hypothetical protein